MNFIYIGKIVNTHGIKGEIRILSHFDKKELIFKKGFSLYLGDQYQKEVIASYRVHKNYDMVTLEGINDINEVLKYKGSKVFIDRDELNLDQDDYLLDDLLGLEIWEQDCCYGIVEDIFDQHGNILLKIKNKKDYYIPYKGNYIKHINVKEKKIEVENVKDLIL